MTPKTCPQIVGDRSMKSPVPNGSGTGSGQVKLKMVNPQVNNPFTCPQKVGDRSGTGASAYLSPVPPSLIGGQGQGQGGTGPRYVPNWQRELGREKARTLKPMDCPGCGRPVMVGPDDEVGGYHEVVAVEPDRLTRLGMYQAATSGRRLFTAHNGRHGLYVNWLGDYATPDPERTHLLAAHNCDLPAADHQPPPPPVDPTDAPPF